MPEAKRKEWPITARGRAFSDEEARLFNHAVSLVVAHGKPEALYVAGRGFGEIANAEVGPFRIERVVTADGPWERKVEIGIAFEGKPVLQASFEQWRRPKKRRELALLCEVPSFIRGDWERALLALSATRVPK